MSNYTQILQSNKKPKSILKNFNKDDILIDEDYVLDIDDLIEKSYEKDNEIDENGSESENES